MKILIGRNCFLASLKIQIKYDEYEVRRRLRMTAAVMELERRTLFVFERVLPEGTNTKV